MRTITLNTLTIDDGIINKWMYIILNTPDTIIAGYTQRKDEKAIEVQIIWDTPEFKHAAKYILTMLDGYFLVMQCDREYLNIFQYELDSHRYIIDSRYKEDSFVCCSLMRWSLKAV